MSHTRKIMYITNYNSNNVSVIDVASQTEKKRIEVGEGPAGLAIAPSGKYAYVANHKGNSISILDLKTEKVIGLLNLTGSPWGIAFTHNGQYAFVAEFENTLPAQRDWIRPSSGSGTSSSASFRSNVLTVLDTNYFN